MQTKGKDIGMLVEKGFLSENEKKALESLMTELRASWPDVKVKVFGSKVKGVADEESDLDILVLMPCTVLDNIRKGVIHMIFDINLVYGTNLSPLILSADEWGGGLISVLPIHAFIEEEGVTL